MTDKKKDSGWRKRVSGSVNQIGQAFPIEPHGDKSKLPKALQQVSLNEIPEMIERRRRKGMTEEELAEEELIDQIIQEEIEEELEAERKKNLLNKLSDALEKMDKRNKLKKALEEEAKNEADTGKDDGYEENSNRLKAIQDANDKNEIFG